MNFSAPPSADGSACALWERWVSTVDRFRNELALVDFGSGSRWTFSQLLDASIGYDLPEGSVSFPSGQNYGFILAVLASWRLGKPACPLEVGQAPPDLSAVTPRYAHLKLTSASGGIAKCVAFTAQQLASDPANIVASMGLRPDWPNLAAISLSHSYGFSNLVLPLLLHGIPLVIVPAPLPQIVRRAGDVFPASTLAAVPALWRSWHESKSFPSNLRLAISAGAPLPFELETNVFNESGLKIHNFYGSSECGGIAYDRSDRPRTDAAFAGTALDNVNLSLGPAGTLRVESGAVGDSYFPEPHPVLKAPVFETTDLAELRDGAVFLHGRATDIINMAGRKVAPESVEAVLRQNGAVVECVVFGVPEKAGQERFEKVVACVHPRGRITVSELTRYLSASLPPWQIPRHWWFTEELLPNARGKISRAEWRKRFLERSRLSVPP